MTWRDRLALWLIRHRLKRCPMCKGARMVHHFGGGEFAELKRCWTCTGSSDYLAETRRPTAFIDGAPAEMDEAPVGGHLHAV